MLFRDLSSEEKEVELDLFVLISGFASAAGSSPNENYVAFRL